MQARSDLLGPPLSAAMVTGRYWGWLISAEDEAGRLALLRSLVRRGVSGVHLVTSDAHEGLEKAIATALPGSSWQRCRTHFMVNLLAKVPRAAQQAVATLVRSIYAQPDAECTREQFDQVLEHLESRLPEAAEPLGDAREELLPFTACPKAVWLQIDLVQELARAAQ